MVWFISCFYSKSTQHTKILELDETIHPQHSHSYHLTKDSVAYGTSMPEWQTVSSLRTSLNVPQKQVPHPASLTNKLTSYPSLNLNNVTFLSNFCTITCSCTLLEYCPCLLYAVLSSTVELCTLVFSALHLCSPVLSPLI